MSGVRAGLEASDRATDWGLLHILFRIPGSSPVFLASPTSVHVFTIDD